MKNITFFYLKNCHFLVVKFSIYLNRRVFVMYLAFNNTALRSNLTAFPGTNTNVSMVFFLHQ